MVKETILRDIVTCAVCNKQFILRTGIGYESEVKFYITCPICDSGIRGKLTLDTEKTYATVSSHDFKKEDSDRFEKVTLPIRNINVDYPIEKKQLNLDLISPYVYFVSIVKENEFMSLMQYQSKVLHYYNKLLPIVKRSETLFSNRKLEQLEKNMLSIAYSINFPPDYKEPDAMYLYLVGLGPSLLHHRGINDKAKKELTVELKKSQRNKPRFLSLLDYSFKDLKFFDFINQTIRTTIVLMDKLDALFLGLASRSLTKVGLNLDDFVVSRDDFEELGSLYKDIFELCWKAYRFHLFFINLSKRGSEERCFDGKNRKPKEIMNLKPYQLENLVNESKEIKKVYSLLNRNIRNLVGHASTRYDVYSGNLIAEGKKKMSLLSFIQTLITSTNVLAYTLSFCYFILNIYKNYHRVPASKIISSLPPRQALLSTIMLTLNSEGCMICSDTPARQVRINDSEGRLCNDCIDIQRKKYGSKIEEFNLEPD